MIGFALGLGVIIGIIFAPFMTVGAIMFHYGHDTLGWVLVVIGIIHMIIKMLDE